MKESKELMTRAELSLRQADGEWSQAVELFSKEVEVDAALRQELLATASEEVLKQAAQRLGTTTRKCPFCAESLVLDAVKCRFCGEWLDQSSPAVSRPAVETSDTGDTIRHFTLLTGWVLIVLVVILIISLAR